MVSGPGWFEAHPENSAAQSVLPRADRNGLAQSAPAFGCITGERHRVNDSADPRGPAALPRLLPHESAKVREHRAEQCSAPARIGAKLRAAHVVDLRNQLSSLLAPVCHAPTAEQPRAAFVLIQEGYQSHVPAIALDALPDRPQRTSRPLDVLQESSPCSSSVPGIGRVRSAFDLCKHRSRGPSNSAATVVALGHRRRYRAIPGWVRESEVPLERDTERVQIPRLGESIDLSCQVDFVTEAVGRRDFGSERRERAGPVVVARVVEPLEV
jgi:hypothetical protein